MADYAIGDIQGCYDPFMRLLEHIRFNEHQDRLWLVGDLVNRGPHSLKVLRFVHNMQSAVRVVLGNHDLHLLSILFAGAKINRSDTFSAILEAPDRDELGQWLRYQDIAFYDPALNFIMSHAGIAPLWDLSQALSHARELTQALRGEEFIPFLQHMYGNDPDWSDDLTGFGRLRSICNYFTRMRVCDKHGQLILHYKGSLRDIPRNVYPWFAVPKRHDLGTEVVFGHWASLVGECPVPGVHALDTGCVYGRTLTALRLQDKQRFSVPGL